MRISFLVEDDEVDVPHADALAARGHEVRVAVMDGYAALEDEFLIATTDATLKRALEIARDRAVLLEEPIVDEAFFRARSRAENAPMRILLPGASQVESNGVEDGYGAAAHARWFHQKFDLIRAAAWAPSREEPLDDVQEFHVGLNIRERTRLFHTCDALIDPAVADERIESPALEAMASGIPTVLSATGPHFSFDELHDYALFAPGGNAVELGEQLIELLSDDEARERVRTRGREVAERFHANKVAERLEALLQRR